MNINLASYLRLVTLVLPIVLLTACDTNPPVSCSDEKAINLVKEQFRDAFKRIATDTISKDKNGTTINQFQEDLSKMMNAWHLLNLNLTAIRTVSVDKSVGKNSCAGRLEFTVANEITRDKDVAASLEKNPIDFGADMKIGEEVLLQEYGSRIKYDIKNVKWSKNTLYTDINYSTQLTDNKKELVVSTSGHQDLAAAAILLRFDIFYHIIN